MAPSTRLSSRPERRVANHGKASSSRVGSSRNPILVEETAPPRKRIGMMPRRRIESAPKQARDARGRFVKSKNTAEPKPDRKKVVKVTAEPKPKKKARSEKTECLICATTKDTTRSFRASKSRKICEHFENVCNSCVQKQIKTKITARQLTDAHLPCMFPGCTAVLDHAALKKVMTTALFETWDAAVTKHLLAADPSYIACLNPKCGVYFSIENCGSKRQISSTKPKPKSKSKSNAKQKQKQEDTDKTACPHCDHAACLSCNRPWHSGSCDSAKKREDKQSENAIKKLGAKPCPKCGVNIEKQGGCDHMNCRRCRHNFCWECLGHFTGNANHHLPTCSHRRPMIAEDIGNFIGDGMTTAQINQAIVHARRELLAGRVPQPTVRLAPGVQLVNGVAVAPPPT
ncbi:uncharacterized protein EKO05_0003094 [Ascochyta rabiei]|uniref:RBR-type E3 ubiquitin transferase n=1 Tax=Didymella rabiei TaxID=5454 RepID=A0A162X9X8_DIDRA|nr:uncharacterized protein EKO05_0003094 [Ascochyta rabiei]KZM19425.1 zinc ion binding [Ascochyta rabiei]UPX12549.1 hypothetical protein EKO05_0003094 [Ascochyta rabiei]